MALLLCLPRNLTERLVFGIAPDDAKELLKQRQRWSTGMLQIVLRDNPLCNAGMAAMQRVLYFNELVYPVAAVPFLFSCLVPLLFLFSGGAISPIRIDAAVRPLWEVYSILLVAYAFMEMALWWALAGDEGSGAGASTERLMLVLQTQQLVSPDDACTVAL